MPTQRICIMLVLCTGILFSCNSKKQNNADKNNLSVTVLDTVALSADEAINVARYNNNFEQSSTQHFTALPNKISVVTARKGLKVTVNPSVLEKEDGTAVDGKITVSIIELTTTGDLFKSNAATVSDGKLLASGGSYFIGMECNGEKLRIKKGKALQMQFPKLKDEEMELFYGNRNADGNMNWNRAGADLIPAATPIPVTDELMFTDNNNFDPVNNLPSLAFNEKNELKLYRSLDEKVYYYKRLMPIKDVVDTINRYSAKVFLDTVYTWPKIDQKKLKPGQRIDSNYLSYVYGPPKQYYFKTYRYAEEEKQRKTILEQKRQEAFNNWQPQQLALQLQKYYTPSNISYLGWINCDRFYNTPKQEEIPLELPYTFTKGSINYFILFKSINGMLSGKLKIDSLKPLSIASLPSGIAATIIVFTKVGGQLYHCKEDFIVNKNKPVKLDFKNISAEEMIKMFGKNVRI